MNILETIVAQKKKEVATLPDRVVSVRNLKAALKARGDRRDFKAALIENSKRGVALIAEVKKASPSAGVIREDFDPAFIARQYEVAGATCLSVLTDEKFFQGALQYLKQIRQTVRLPLLRKDFIIDERQLFESVEWGADAILLIVSILPQDKLKAFHQLALSSGLAALVEVHDEAELERALDAGAEIIGVNNRDLKTFKVDLKTTERIAAKLRGTSAGKKKILVAESGIHTRADVERLRKVGVNAILVGESLMREDDIPAKAQQLIGGR
ncbi:MAG: indole-3-glycerol phosphate synthase TrpC [Verrucomicrobiota bacterium]